MQIKYIRGQGILLGFPTNELSIVLVLLKALNQAQPQDFIAEAIHDIERDLPKKLAPPNYMHICVRCCRIMDARHDNVMRVVIGDDDHWNHNICPPTREDRP